MVMYKKLQLLSPTSKAVERAERGEASEAPQGTPPPQAPPHPKLPPTLESRCFGEATAQEQPS